MFLKVQNDVIDPHLLFTVDVPTRRNYIDLERNEKFLEYNNYSSFKFLDGLCYGICVSLREPLIVNKQKRLWIGLKVCALFTEALPVGWTISVYDEGDTLSKRQLSDNFIKGEFFGHEVDFPSGDKIAIHLKDFSKSVVSPVTFTPLSIRIVLPSLKSSLESGEDEFCRWYKDKFTGMEFSGIPIYLTTRRKLHKINQEGKVEYLKNESFALFLGVEITNSIKVYAEWTFVIEDTERNIICARKFNFLFESRKSLYGSTIQAKLPYFSDGLELNVRIFFSKFLIQ